MPTPIECPRCHKHVWVPCTDDLCEAPVQPEEEDEHAS